MLTACGIETFPTTQTFLYFFARCNSAYRLRYWNFSQLTVSAKVKVDWVATVLTACGIETISNAKSSRPTFRACCNSAYRLRYWNVVLKEDKQFNFSNYVATVLTACGIETNLLIKITNIMVKLQQCLPLAVLKPCHPYQFLPQCVSLRCNSAYRLRYWNDIPFFLRLGDRIRSRCNSAYRLRYWNSKSTLNQYEICSTLQQCLPLAVLKPDSDIRNLFLRY